MTEKIINTINPQNKDLKEFTPDELLIFLEKLNRLLRLEPEGNNVFEENMQAGDLVSPTKEVKMMIINDLCEGIKNIEDKDACAAMVYYTLLNLHMFSDGNGRTSRFIYDLISDNLSDDNIHYYFHKDSGKVTDEKGDLEVSKGILDISIVNRIPDEIILNYLNFIPQDVLDKYDWFSVYKGKKIDTIMSQKVLDELGNKNIADLKHILSDGYGALLSPGGIAMLYGFYKKGQLDIVVKNSDQIINERRKSGFYEKSVNRGLDRKFRFEIYENPELISSWTVDDFKDVIKMGNYVKYLRLKSIIDIFVEPQKFINSDTGNTYKYDILTNFGQNKKNKSV